MGNVPFMNREIKFSPETIEIQVYKDEVYTGEFEICDISNEKEEIQGYIYSSSSRMRCLQEEFKGNNRKIKYQYDAKGLKEGDSREGELYILCDQKETSLHFQVQVIEKYVETVNGKIRDLNDFAELARINWHEAYKIFYSQFFVETILENRPICRMLYRGINKSEHSNHNLEEFLIATHKKKNNILSVEKKQLEFSLADKSSKEYIEIRKSTWGSLEFTVSTDCKFITIEKETYTEKDFIGNACRIFFMINNEKIHDGNNFAKMTIKNVYQTIEIKITVNKDVGLEEIVKSIQRQIKESKLKVGQAFIELATNAITKEKFVEKSIMNLNHLSALEPNEEIYNLLKIYTYILGERRFDAKFEMDNIFVGEVQKEKLEDLEYKEFYQLLKLMLGDNFSKDSTGEKVESLVSDATDEKKENSDISDNINDNIKLIRILKEAVEGNDRRNTYNELLTLLEKGNNSVALMNAMYGLIRLDPILIGKIRKEEERLLMWAYRHQGLTLEIANQIFEISASVKKYSHKFYLIMCGAYSFSQKKEHLAAICGYLIKSQKFEEKYHQWYEEAISEKVKITGLYEAFLQSADENNLKTIPQEVKLYFKYGETVENDKLAILYSKIIKEKYKDAETYEAYKEIIRKFAREQLEKNKINENLAVIYNDFISLEDDFASYTTKEQLGKIIFTNKIKIDNPEIVRAYIYEMPLKKEREISFIKNQGYFEKVTDQYEIIFQDRYGKRYSNKISYTVVPLFDVEKCVDYFSDYIKNEKNYLIYKMENNQPQYILKMQNQELLEEGYKARTLFTAAEYFDKQEETTKAIQAIKEIDLRLLDPEKRKKVVDMFVKYKQFQKAAKALQEYGDDIIETGNEIGVTNYLIKEDCGEYKNLVKSLATRIFISGYYNEDIINFLCENFMGSTLLMLRIWNTSLDMSDEIHVLEERILQQMMYCNVEVPKKNNIFESYCRNGGKEMIVLAFLTKLSHEYFEGNETMPKYAVNLLKTRYIKCKPLNDTCNLALLKILSTQKELDSNEYEIAEGILEDFVSRKILFGFYKKLPYSLVEKFNLADKVFVEYKGKPNKKVIIKYCYDKNEKEKKLAENEEVTYYTEEVKEMYSGIYVKVFTLFFGELLKYEFLQEKNRGFKVVKRNQVVNNFLRDKDEINRYNMLNQMIISNRLKDDDLIESLDEYKKLDDLTSEMFIIL